MDAIQTIAGAIICGSFILGPIMIAVILRTAVAAYNRTTNAKAFKEGVPDLLFGQAFAIGLLAVFIFFAANWVLRALFDQGQLEPDDNTAAMRLLAFVAGVAGAIISIVAGLENTLKVGFDKVFLITLYCIPVTIIVGVAIAAVYAIVTYLFVPMIQ